MNSINGGCRLLLLFCFTSTIVLLAQIEASKQDRPHQGQQLHQLARSSSEQTNNGSHTPTFFERIRGEITRPISALSQSSAINSTSRLVSADRTGKDEVLPVTASHLEAESGGDDDDDELADDNDDEEEEDDDDEDDDAELVAGKQTALSRQLAPRGDKAKIVTDIFGNKIKLENNRTILVSQNKARDLGLLTVKALLLGPLIGLTLKAALFRGLIWAVGAYLMHTFAPSLLGAFGLGSGLVGFARQLQPDYIQMLMPHLANIPNNLRNVLPESMQRLVTQYRLVFEPVIEAIRSIPEGHCRFRAVCETANHLVHNTQFMSNSLQRLSATVYLNFGTEYSKAWLDGIVQSDCAQRYAQCTNSPFSLVAARLAEAVRPRMAPNAALS